MGPPRPRTPPSQVAVSRTRDSRVDIDSEPPRATYDERSTPVMHEGTVTAQLYAHGLDIQRCLSTNARHSEEIGSNRKELRRLDAKITEAIFDLSRRFALDDEAKERAARELAAAQLRSATRSGRLWGVITAVIGAAIIGLGAYVWHRLTGGG